MMMDKCKNPGRQNMKEAGEISINCLSIINMTHVQYCHALYSCFTLSQFTIG